MPETPAVPTPGWKSSEFAITLLIGVAISIVTFVQESAAALPAWAQAAVALVAPVALAWLGRQYAAGRTALKVAHVEAAKPVTSDAEAAAVLRAPSAG